MIKYKGLTTLEVLTEAKNYNKWIAEELKKYTTAPLLEIGAGTGNLTKFFSECLPITITDCDKGLVSNLKSQFGKNNNTYVDLLRIDKKIPAKYISKFSTVLGINVLEHIEDDEKALQNIYKTLKNGGKIVLLVPAKKRAFTRLDLHLGHFRRYEKEELYNKLNKTGFEIESLYFFNLAGLLSWYIRDKISRNKIYLTPNHIKAFDSIVPLLRFIENHITIPMGISLIAVARKQK